MKDDKPRKQKLTTQEKREQRFPTRAQAIKLLNQGADPNATFRDEKGTERQRYTSHPNVHVRQLAWKKLGKPTPSKPEERVEFFKALHMKDPELKVEELIAEPEAIAPEQPSEPQP